MFLFSTLTLHQIWEAEAAKDNVVFRRFDMETSKEYLPATLYRLQG